jgi:hypothetical protein
VLLKLIVKDLHGKNGQEENGKRVQAIVQGAATREEDGTGRILGKQRRWDEGLRG